ncbi:hypothetical protein G4Z16_13875 [Streptomyces bathyalis]|uniref:Uncharacterized protein n=1 Tax=Streptomyces bathyalis TaxID=2710756 RepID=A0A7T1T6J0_9ACTN|nr:hypothetical protein [Streptomyces bathyalis]QPP07294.1 hypothetical protein G4Z16_13875 [Streptomyces bathyalis]
MNPIIIGAMITGSFALVGAIGAAVITARSRPSETPASRRPPEAVALFEIVTATAKGAFAFTALGGALVLATLALVLPLVF